MVIAQDLLSGKSTSCGCRGRFKARLREVLGELLTDAELAALAGVSVHAIRQRRMRGLTGAALIWPPPGAQSRSARRALHARVRVA